MKLSSPLSPYPVLLALAAAASSFQIAHGGVPDCPSCSSLATCTMLNELVTYLVCKAPFEASEAYAAPSTGFLSDWKQTVGNMLLGQDCDTMELPESLLAKQYQLEAFTDDSEDYCVLASFALDDNDEYLSSPYGAVIVNMGTSGGAVKDLSIDIPHSINDDETFRQGIAIYKGTNARTFTLSTSHRRATTEISCQGDTYMIADAAHNRLHTFQMNAEAIKAYYELENRDFTAIQLHGMGTTQCLSDDIFMSHGFIGEPQAGGKLELLRDAMRNEITDSTTATMVTESDCSLAGTKNTQGRLYNGVNEDDVCTVAQTSYSGTFIHVEQKRDIRTSTAFDQVWINALNAVDFSLAAPPEEPPSLTLTSFNSGETMYMADDVEITWDSTCLDSSELVKLSIHGASDLAYLKTIADPAPNTGTFTWKVSNSLPTDTDLIVRIRSEADTSILDYSEAPFRAASRISITSADIDGMSFAAGDDIPLEWSVDGVDLVQVALFEGTSYKTTILPDVPASDNTHVWTVPSTLAPGSNYRIRVRSMVDSSCRDYTSYFTISESVAVVKSLTLTSPNGGQVLARRDRNVEITWTSEGLDASEKVQIALTRSDKSFASMIVRETDNTGSYVIPSVGTRVRTGDDLLVRIRSVSDKSMKDWSDAPITVLDSRIAISNPVGGETFSVGDTLPVEWTVTDLEGADVYISLMKGRRHKKTLVRRVSGSLGRYDHWIIPEGLEDGDNYRIRVRHSDKSKAYIRQFSGYFRIQSNAA